MLQLKCDPAVVGPTKGSADQVRAKDNPKMCHEAGVVAPRSARSRRSGLSITARGCVVNRSDVRTRTWLRLWMSCDRWRMGNQRSSSPGRSRRTPGVLGLRAGRVRVCRWVGRWKMDGIGTEACTLLVSCGGEGTNAARKIPQ